MDVIYKTDEAETVTDELIKFIVNNEICDEITFQKIPSSSKTLKQFKHFADKSNYLYQVRANVECPFITLPTSYKELSNHLSGSMNYLIRKNYRKLKKYENVEFSKTIDRNELESDFSELVRLHQLRWNSKKLPGVFSSERFAGFQRKIMPIMLDNGHLDLRFLSVSGQKIAALYNIYYNDKIYFYQAGLDASFDKSLSPGIMLHIESIKEAIDNGIREYDFLLMGKKDEYKQRWANDNRRLSDVYLARPGISKLLMSLNNTVGKFKRQIKRDNQPASNFLLKMEIKVIKSEHELDSIGSEWNQLLENSRYNVVQLRHEWIMAWWKNFGKKAELFVVTVFDANKKLVGIAPLLKEKSHYRKVTIRKISLMANGHSPSSDFIVSKKYSNYIIRHIVSYLLKRNDWEVIDLKKVYMDQYTSTSLIDYLEKEGQPFGIKNNVESPYIIADSDWDTFFNKRSNRFKKSMRNKLNRMNKSNYISIDQLRITDSNDPVISEMFSVSGKSWKKKAGTAITSSEDTKGFYRDLCDRLGSRDIITVWMMRKGITPIAFEFHLTYKNITYPVRADYDESFKALSPGSILEYHIIKNLFDASKIHEYNSCGHTYDYLLKWTDSTRRLINYEIFNKNFKSFPLYIFEYKFLPFIRRLFVKTGN
ncbi:MAG: GNAT family N-acetyltransferase [bacterium]